MAALVPKQSRVRRGRSSNVRNGVQSELPDRVIHYDVLNRRWELVKTLRLVKSSLAECCGD